MAPLIIALKSDVGIRTFLSAGSVRPRVDTVGRIGRRAYQNVQIHVTVKISNCKVKTEVRF